ncbi:hypothetical protein ACWD7F_34140 [Streptomyces sp. NPDC005122]
MGSSESGGELKVTDQYLRDFANVKIQAFLDSLRSENTPAINGISRFAAGTGTGVGGVTGVHGDYTKLLGGNGKVLPTAQDLQDQFKAFCVSLDKLMSSLGGQMSKAQLDLQGVQSTLHNAEDEALTAAQMMQILNDVVGGTNNVP